MDEVLLDRMEETTTEEHFDSINSTENFIDHLAEEETIANESSSSYRILTAERNSGRGNRISSTIWKYFSIAEKINPTVTEVDQNAIGRILCMECFNKGEVQVYKKSTSTSNLWRHLEKKHGIAVPKEKIISVVGVPNCNDVHFMTSTFDRSELEDDDEQKHLSKRELEDVAEITVEDETIVVEEQHDDHRGASTTINKDIGSALLNEVSKRPLIYEHHSNKAAMRTTREVLWDEIYDVFDGLLPVERLQKIWKNIRDRYKKIRNTERVSGIRARPKYKYYDQMRFLETDDSLKDLNEVFLSEPPTKKRKAKFVEPAIKESTDKYEYDDYSEKNDTEEEISEDVYAECPQDTVKFNPLQNADIHRTMNSSQSCHCSQQSTAPVPPMDEFDLFGKFIAEKLRSIPKDSVNEVEMNIMGVLMGNVSS